MSIKPNILIVDDELSVRESLRMILKDTYNVLTAANGQEGLEMTKQGVPVLAILDVRMPDIDGIELLKQMKDKYPQLPVIILTGVGTHRMAIEAIKSGAVNFIVKPINVPYVRKLIEDTLIEAEERLPVVSPSPSVEETLKSDYLNTLKVLSKVIESRDPYTKRHSERVAEYAVEIAKELGLSSEEIEIIEQTALLHDIGKIGIKDTILNKPGKLNAEEWEEVKKHPENGEEILQPFKLLHIEQTMIRHHHERFDGTGYPDGLKGKEIPIYARILAVADSFEAMTSLRPYHQAFSLQEAKEELGRYKGSQFDPEIVEALLNVLRREEMDKVKKKILLIDDDEHIFMSIRMVFEERYQLSYAEDGKQGCEEAKRLTPDLIILDSRMPGLSGRETLLSLRAQDDKVPIIFLTAFPEDVVSQVGNIGRVSCFIAKPFNIDKLKEAVDRLIEPPD